jgi:hypothetical protein
MMALAMARGEKSFPVSVKEQADEHFPQSWHA